MKQKDKLTPKQLRFCYEYLKDSNAVQSAIRAGYSVKTANKQGSQILGKTWVKQKIAELQKQEEKKARISRKEVIQVLADIIRTDAPGLFKDGRLKSESEMTSEEKKCIESIKLSKGKTEIKLYSKLSAIERLNRMMGWESPEKTKTDLKITWEEKRNGTNNKADSGN